jgi:hypothetical protein
LQKRGACGFQSCSFFLSYWYQLQVPHRALLVQDARKDEERVLFLTDPIKINAPECPFLVKAQNQQMQAWPCFILDIPHTSGFNIISVSKPFEKIEKVPLICQFSVSYK